jgi:molybdenum cofactor biosynthesis enzyme MoaA
MCGIWENNASFSQKSELSTQELDQILTDRLFSKIEDLNINGGEFTLREDLPEVIQTAVNRLPALREISMSTNGLMTRRLVDQVKQIKQICAPKIALSVNISIHGLGDVADQVYGIQGAYDKQLKTILAMQEIAKEGNFKVGLSCVIMNANINALRPLLAWSQERQLGIRFSVVEKRERFYNLDKGELYEIEASHKDTAVKFLQELSRHKGLFEPSAYAYDYLVNLLQSNQVRTMSCDYILGGFILGSQGELYYCPHDEAIGNCKDKSAFALYYDSRNLAHRRSSLIQQKCLHCPPKYSGHLLIQVDAFKYLKFLMTSYFRDRRNS